MLLPLSDDDRHLLKPAWVTISFIALNVAVFVIQFLVPDFTYRFSAVPVEITTGEDLVTSVEVPGPDGEPVEIPHGPGPWPLQLTLLTSMFMHGGLLHLGGNLLFLWIFGDNVEHRFGASRFLLFYLGSGLAAGLAHALLEPASVVPMLGASGAISGVLGAYLVLFPKNKVRALLLVWIISVPAWVVIGLWIGMQFIGGAGMLAEMITTGQATGGVSYAAHIGGLLTGMILAVLFRLRMKEEPANPFTAAILDRSGRAR